MRFRKFSDISRKTLLSMYYETTKRSDDMQMLFPFNNCINQPDFLVKNNNYN